MDDDLTIHNHINAINTIANAYLALAEHHHPEANAIGDILAGEIERFTSPTLVIEEPSD